MGQYSVKGLYSAYDKNNKERDALDYYATPPEEVLNILNTLQLDLENEIILEPCIGGGHMLEAIKSYYSDFDLRYVGTDIKDRGYSCTDEDTTIEYNLDFMADDYPYNEADWVIMNPPFSIVEPFVIRSLDIARKGIIMFGRLQFLEGEKRYKQILKDNPPTDIYVYVDRVACYKDGNFSIKPNSVQAYAWFIWDKEKEAEGVQCHWLRRANKK